MSIKYLDEYRDVENCMEASRMIKGISTKSLNIMEVCGGHTMAIRKNGLQKIVGENIKFLSGPGCPVCVTSLEGVDRVIELARSFSAVICTFGDLFRVPGTEASLQDVKAEGADVRIVYTVSDVIDLAREEPEKSFVFVSLGFETTTPTIAASILQAKRENIKNFYIIAYNKTMPNALRAVLGNKSGKIDALICPGHVTAITGLDIYRFIGPEFGVSCCVSGFEPLDILKSVYVLADLHEKGEVTLVNAYERAVSDKGNVKAREIMYDVFEPADAVWRGVGPIPLSGLRLKSKYKEFDAETVFDIKGSGSKEDPGCICGDILVGAKNPGDCKLFRRTCDPTNPRGACMVSSEGACAAWYKYGE